MQFFLAQVRESLRHCLDVFNVGCLCAIVTCLILISDGQRILSCGADHFMKVLDVHTGTEVYSKDVGEEIRCVLRGGGVLSSLCLPRTVDFEDIWWT